MSDDATNDAADAASREHANEFLKITRKILDAISQKIRGPVHGSITAALEMINATEGEDLTPIFQSASYVRGVVSCAEWFGHVKPGVSDRVSVLLRELVKAACGVYGADISDATMIDVPTDSEKPSVH